jgi:hypothetical protein
MRTGSKRWKIQLEHMGISQKMILTDSVFNLSWPGKVHI